MVSAAAIFSTNCRVTTSPAISEACTEKKVPAAATGVPLRTPAALKVRPVGSEPEATDHVTGGSPPDTVKFCE